MNLSSVVILPRQAWQTFRFLPLFLDVSTTQNLSASTEATRKITDHNFSMSPRVVSREHTTSAEHHFKKKWKRNGNIEKRVETTSTIYNIYTIYIIGKHDNRGKFHEKSYARTRPRWLPFTGQLDLTSEILRKLTFAHTNRPKLTSNDGTIDFLLKKASISSYIFVKTKAFDQSDRRKLII